MRHEDMAMTYKRVVPNVILAHVAVLGLLLVIPLLRNCSWFKKPQPEVMEIDLGSLAPPPPSDPVPPDPPEPEEEDVIAENTPVPTPRPTADPTPVPTATPRPEATPTPRPRPTPTPTPRRYLTPEQIRERIRNQQNPQPVPTARPVSAQDLLHDLSDGLPTTASPQIGGTGGGSGAGVNFGGVKEVLYNKLYSAWQQPRHLSGAAGFRATAEVVVAKNGSVQSSRLRVRSGIQEFDQSVESALSSVTFAKELPADFEGSSRTFLFEFKLSD